MFSALPVLPKWLCSAILAIAAWQSLDRALGHPYRVALNVLRGLGRKMPERDFLSFRIMDEISLNLLRCGASPPHECSTESIAKALCKPFSEMSGLRLAYEGKAAVSPNRNKLVGSSDRAGITILSPYLHPRIKQFASSLPDALMRPSRKTKSKVTGKYILMRMAEEKKLLPSAVIHQPKMAAVDGPIDEWYQGPMRDMLLELMRGLPFSYDEDYVAGLLRTKPCERLFKRFVMTDKVITHAASLLATYATFCAAQMSLSRK